MKKKDFFKKAVIVSFVVLSFLFFSWGGAFHLEEVLAKEIIVKIGATFDLTGPLGVQGRKMATTLNWFQEYVNEEKGGLKDVEGNTVKLKYLLGDTNFKPAQTLSLYKKYKSEGVVAVSQVGSVELAAVRSIALRDKMPLPTNSGSLVYPLPSPCTGHWPDFGTCSASAIDYVKEKWEKSNAPWTKKRGPRLAFIGPEGYPSWAASITPEVMRYARLQGVEVVGKIFIPMRVIDSKPQVMSAKKAGADFIYTGIVVSQGGAVARDLYELGFRGDPTKEKGKIEIIGMFPMSPIQMIKLAGRQEAIEGMRIIGSHTYIWEDQPSLRIIRRYAEKYNETNLLDLNYVAKWYDCMRTEEAIRLALLKVSGDKLKRKHVWDAFLRIKDFDTGGIFQNKVTLTEEERIGMEKVRVDEAYGKDGKKRLVTYTDFKMLAPMYTEAYAKAHGKKSIYSRASLEILQLKEEEVGFQRIKE
ncbi:MAG: ABC transporter substrate-binding protein [Thermodesulfobacteriota bacterium]|nr:ABC transporter substrate-binding protein [Thermodesulfobacteriota bacterium]